MRFEELDSKMRVFETLNDTCVLPEMYIVARIDGRSFSRLTKEVCKFEAPFDVRFRDMMLCTVEHLMNCGFQVIYGYTQSDEISLLCSKNADSFNRKERKWNSVLAGEASGAFSSQLGKPVAFDCRISQLPTMELVADYFLWRQEDAFRNSLNAYSYWTLRDKGWSKRDATEQLRGMATSAKHDLLFAEGINFNDVPNWQKRGCGLYWADVEKTGWNPVIEREEATLRRKIYTNEELPMRDEYSALIQGLVADTERK